MDRTQYGGLSSYQAIPILLKRKNAEPVLGSKYLML